PVHRSDISADEVAVDSSSAFEGADIYVEPAAFCGVAARMLASEGRDGVPAVLTLLAQALRAEIRLIEAGTTRAAIPRPRIRVGAADDVDLVSAAPIDLPIRLRGNVIGL